MKVTSKSLSSLGYFTEQDTDHEGEVITLLFKKSDPFDPIGTSPWVSSFDDRDEINYFDELGEFTTRVIKQ